VRDLTAAAARRRAAGQSPPAARRRAAGQATRAVRPPLREAPREPRSHYSWEERPKKKKLPRKPMPRESAAGCPGEGTARSQAMLQPPL
jgi:hypothetical protein